MQVYRIKDDCHMKDMEFTVQDIKDVMEAMRKNRIAGFKLAKGDFSIEIEGGGAAQTELAVRTAVVERALPEDAAEAAPAGDVVKSPIVGTFYAAPAPDKDPFVRVGSRVSKGDVLFIIESMKLMNEVTSDYSGTVAEILVENGQGVEYGQPILRIE
jgi:acetyl-CoA carboxylase biotin carboxyl carrier protein